MFEVASLIVVNLFIALTIGFILGYLVAKRNPSIKSLEKIINALDINYGCFFKDM